MKKLLVLFALCATASAQTYRAVTADTNNVIRTNFTIPNAQVTGLSALLDGKLATNGDGSGLTNLPNANLTNATGILPIVSGGTGQTNAAAAIEALLPSYTGNSNAVLALDSNATSLVWSTNVGGGGGIVDLADNTNGVTNTLSVANGGTGGTDQDTALIGLIYKDTSAAINIGSGADAGSAASHNIAIGLSAKTLTTNSQTRSMAIGAFAQATNARAVAIGGIARASAADAWQLGTGTNTTTNTIQWLSAGTIHTNEWAALANAGTVGTNVLRSTNAEDAQAAIFPATTTNAPTNTNAPTPDAWLDVTVGTNAYKLPLWQ